MASDLELARRSHALLVRAMEVEAGARRAFVEAQCAGDAALLARMHALLDASERSDAFLSRPALDPVEAEIPDAVGDYVVVGVLGSGGMATVYEAEQERPRRRVALKVLHQSVTSPEMYQRFVFETEALARLRHPGIAQIYEAGAARLGPGAPSPFFAMELVPGASTITAYADRRGLGVRERLRMLASVCDAVHHGHQQGIIHRDLKPGNVLVDDQGRAKVIDFGVARRAAAGGVADGITRAGDAGQIVGTLGYMSPEQCGSGAEVDIRTDVYALGALLHELVCGRAAWDLSGLGIGAAVERIVRGELGRIEVGGVARGRDLEAIIRRSMARDPEDRYDSASALATDIRHYLEDRPIEARAPGVMEQARLFARRNPGVVAAAGVVLVSVALVAVVSTASAVLVSREARRRLEAERTAIAERDQARWRAYTADIAGALSAMQAGEYLQMRARLADVSYGLRGWEWGFLSRMAERSTRVIDAHDDLIHDMAMSGDGRVAYTGAGDGTVGAWDVVTGARRAWHELAGGARVTGVAVLGDGGVVAVGDAEGGVHLLDAATLEERGRIGPIAGGVRGLAALAGGRLAIGSPGVAGVWSAGTGAIEAWPGEQEGGVYGVAVSADGRWVATFNDAGVVCIRRGEDLSIARTLEFPAQVAQVRFSPDGRVLAAVGSASRLMLWRVDDGAVLHSIEATGGINTVRSVAFSADGSMVVAGLIHRGIAAFRVADGGPVGRLGGHTEAVSGLAMSGGQLVSSSWDGTVRTWDPAEIASAGGMVTLRGHTDHVFATAFSPDGSWAASASLDGTVRLWDAALREEITALRALDGASATALAFSPDGGSLAVGGSGPVVRVIDLATGAVRAELDGHGRGVASVAFDPTGRRVATGGQDGVARVWDVAAERLDLTLAEHSGRVNSVAFSPDGRWVATGSRDRTVRLWNAATGAAGACMSEHDLDVFAVLFSADGQRLYSGSRDQTIRVWDVATGGLVDTLGGHGQYVTCLSLSPDGTRLAAGSWFGEVVLFDVETSDMIASLRAHEAAIRGVAFSPDGRWLATGSYDGAVRLMDSWTREESEGARGAAREALEAARQRVGGAMEGVRGLGLAPGELVERLRAGGVNPGESGAMRRAVLEAVRAGAG